MLIPCDDGLSEKRKMGNNHLKKISITEILKSILHENINSKLNSFPDRHPNKEEQGVLKDVFKTLINSCNFRQFSIV